MQSAHEAHFAPAGCGMSPPVCWKSIFAGAVAAAVLSLVLLSLGAGLGLVAFSPFGGDTESVASFTVKMAVWMIVMQWLSAALGGYMAGRLRGKPMDTPRDEVFFRDTAHGFLTWAVATLLTAALLTGAASSVASGGAKAATALSAGAAAGAAHAVADQRQGQGYYIDRMFRNVSSGENAAGGSVQEASRILVTGLAKGEVPDADKEYLAQKISAEAGISVDEAKARVNETISSLEGMKQEAAVAAEKALKASGTFSIFTALSMLIGAFIAAVAAAVGGRERDFTP